MAKENYETLDLAYSPAVQGGNKAIVSTSLLCPYHEKLQQEKANDYKTKQNKKNFCSGFLFNRNTFKSSLEKKLQHHGIKMSIKANKKQKVQPMDRDEQTGEFKFSLSELKILTRSQSKVIIASFEARIAELTKQLKDFKEENERLADDKEGLQLTVRNLEELSLRTMKPWVNLMPQSDELTRVMLLN